MRSGGLAPPPAMPRPDLVCRYSGSARAAAAVCARSVRHDSRRAARRRRAGACRGIGDDPNRARLLIVKRRDALDLRAGVAVDAGRRAGQIERGDQGGGGWTCCQRLPRICRRHIGNDRNRRRRRRRAGHDDLRRRRRRGGGDRRRAGQPRRRQGRAGLLGFRHRADLASQAGSRGGGSAGCRVGR